MRLLERTTKTSDIEIEPGLDLIPKDPEAVGGPEFLIWNGEAVVGSLTLVLRGERPAQPPFLLEEQLSTNGFLEKSISALSQYASEQAAYDRLVVTVATDDAPAIETLEKLGFRLAESDNTKKTRGFELYADKDRVSYPPMRVDLDESSDINRLTP
ncbi:MAG: hypothetical protein AAB896_02065 [Patescibacteria group bacterium]